METWLHSAISTAWQVIAPSVREIRSILGQPPPSSFTWPHAVILGSWNRRPKIPPYYHFCLFSPWEQRGS